MKLSCRFIVFKIHWVRCRLIRSKLGTAKGSRVAKCRVKEFNSFGQKVNGKLIMMMICANFTVDF